MSPKARLVKIKFPFYGILVPNVENACSKVVSLTVCASPPTNIARLERIPSSLAILRRLDVSKCDL